MQTTTREAENRAEHTSHQNLQAWKEPSGNSHYRWLLEWTHLETKQKAQALDPYSPLK